MKDAFNQDHFALFGLPRTFRLDTGALDNAYRALQAQVHPDKHAHLPEAERRRAMQWATRTNEAYQTLKRPVDRARYLLALRGVDTAEETHTAMPGAFLMEQMELREALQGIRDAGDLAALDRLARDLKARLAQLTAEMAAQLDEAGDDAGAALNVRKLRFLEKLGREIDDAYEALET